MSLDDEIAMTEEVIQAARNAAAEHLQRAKDVLRLGTMAGARYEDFLSATLRTAESTLVHCKKIIAVREIPEQERAQAVHGITEGVRESVRAMYVGMTLIEHLAGSADRGHAQPWTAKQTAEGEAPRACSFCGRTEAQARLAAGPQTNICEICTRLICDVLGIRLSENDAT